MSHNKYTLHIHFVLHLQPLEYPIHSFYSLHTTSLKYMKHCALLAGKSKRLLYPKGDVPTRMSYGNEYECSFLSVQIVVSFTQTQLSK